MAFVQRSADQQHRHVPFGPPLQKSSYGRDKHRDLLSTFKEQHEALLEVQRDSFLLATANSQRTL